MSCKDCQRLVHGCGCAPAECDKPTMGRVTVVKVDGERIQAWLTDEDITHTLRVTGGKVEVGKDYIGLYDLKNNTIEIITEVVAPRS